jgi:cytochrome c oxidase cbb3-type subunit II
VKMTPLIVVIGCLLIFSSVLFVSFLLPWHTISEEPSDIFRPRTALEEEGRRIYRNNGCTYCHTQFVRPIDWGPGAERISQAGDYVQDTPHLVGTERWGPDLSQQGGQHPDDWHVAHFINPRFTRPESLMPNWEFLGMEKINTLIAYLQSLGFKLADQRMERQNYWKEQAIAAFRAGPDANVKWMHDHVPVTWRSMPNPYETTDYRLARGHRVYQAFCIGCHGPIGDGMGPAQPYLDPPPLNFTILRGRGVTGGILYYQIMNGITGTAMPYFKNELESEKIWAVGDYVAVYFIGESDAGTETGNIDVANAIRGPEAEALEAEKETK